MKIGKIDNNTAFKMHLEVSGNGAKELSEATKKSFINMISTVKPQKADATLEIEHASNGLESNYDIRLSQYGKTLRRCMSNTLDKNELISKVKEMLKKQFIDIKPPKKRRPREKRWSSRHHCFM